MHDQVIIFAGYVLVYAPVSLALAGLVHAANKKENAK